MNKKTKGKKSEPVLKILSPPKILIKLHSVSFLHFDSKLLNGKGGGKQLGTYLLSLFGLRLKAVQYIHTHNIYT